MNEAFTWRAIPTVTGGARRHELSTLRQNSARRTQGGVGVSASGVFCSFLPSGESMLQTPEGAVFVSMHPERKSGARFFVFRASIAALTTKVVLTQ